MLGDRESGSFWLHLTGTCVYGPLQGRQLQVSPLLHTTAGRAADAYPGAELALSRLSLAQRLVRRGQEATVRLLNGRLPPGFQWTMGEIDARLPLMAHGLAVWTDRRQRFYPLKTLHARGGALIDAPWGAGRNLLVGIDPASGVPYCLYTGATACNWQEETLVLDTGETLRGPILYDAQGRPLAAERPLASITCWYSYAFTFPGGELYA